MDVWESESPDYHVFSPKPPPLQALCCPAPITARGKEKQVEEEVLSFSQQNHAVEVRVRCMIGLVMC